MSQQNKPIFTRTELITLMSEADLLPRWRGAIRADARPLLFQSAIGMAALAVVSVAGQGLHQLYMPKGIEMALLGFYLLACVALLFFTGNRMMTAWAVGECAQSLSYEEIRIEIHGMDHSVVEAYVIALKKVGRDLFSMTSDDIDRLHRIEAEFTVKSTLRARCRPAVLNAAA